MHIFIKKYLFLKFFIGSPHNIEFFCHPASTSVCVPLNSALSSLPAKTLFSTPLINYFSRLCMTLSGSVQGKDDKLCTGCTGCTGCLLIQLESSICDTSGLPPYCSSCDSQARNPARASLSTDLNPVRATVSLFVFFRLSQNNKKQRQQQESHTALSNNRICTLAKKLRMLHSTEHNFACR